MKKLFFTMSLLAISTAAFSATIFDNPSVKNFLLKHYIHGDDYAVESPTILGRKVLTLTSLYNDRSRTGWYKNIVLDSNFGSKEFAGNNLKISVKINRPTFQNVALLKVVHRDARSIFLADTTTFEGSMSYDNQFEINLSGEMIINNQVAQINFKGCESFTVDSDNRLLEAFGCKSGEITDGEGDLIYKNVGFIYIANKDDNKTHKIIENN